MFLSVIVEKCCSFKKLTPKYMFKSDLKLLAIFVYRIRNLLFAVVMDEWRTKRMRLQHIDKITNGTLFWMQFFVGVGLSFSRLIVHLNFVWIFGSCFHLV